MTLDVDAIKAKLTEDEKVHFYCVQLFMAEGPNVHLHAPITGPILTKEQCWTIAQEVMTTGKVVYGDDPYYCIAAKFNPDHITGVMVKHKQTVTRKELAEAVSKKESSSHQKEENPFAKIMRSMQ